MGFISKIELKKQLREMGVKVEGNYVKKSDIENTILSSATKTLLEDIATTDHTSGNETLCYDAGLKLFCTVKYMEKGDAIKWAKNHFKEIHQVDEIIENIRVKETRRSKP